jgi:hypothetical protein
MRALLLLLFVASAALAREVRLANGLLCVDTATTYLMRDTTSSCGHSTTFCTTPLNCFSSMTRQYVGGGVVTCRAISAGSPGSPSMITPVCPDLQTCADDPHQQFIREDEAYRWSPPPR